jgi:chloride channel 7
LQTSLDEAEENVSDRFFEIPLYMLVGIGGGILGGFFLQAVAALRKLRSACLQSLSGKYKTVLQLSEVMTLSIITSTILFILPVAFLNTCKEVGHVHAAAIHAKPLEPNISNLFYCQPGETNEIATLLLGSRNEAIKRILADPSSFERMNLFVIGMVFYLLMIITFGVSIPSGIFTPVVLSGSSLGGVLGDIFKSHIEPNIQPSTFAVIGVAALLAGIQRSTVSTCVILVEATGMNKKIGKLFIHGRCWYNKSTFTFFSRL